MPVLHKNHRKTYQILVFTLVLDSDNRFTIFAFDLEWPVLHITLNVRIFHLATNQSLRVEDCILRVRMECIFSGVTDTTNC